MRMTCRILPHVSADGPANMALDEALLDTVSADPGNAYLRTYEWTEPTLSLGYFQRLADVQSDPRWRSAAVVRRLTGGGAIWHHHEVTYALIVPASHPLARPNTALYRAVHAAIVEMLAGVGIKAERRGDDASPDRPGLDRPLLCFTDRDPEDLVYQGFKIVGRRTEASSWCNSPARIAPPGPVTVRSRTPWPRGIGGRSPWPGRLVCPTRETHPDRSAHGCPVRPPIRRAASAGMDSGVVPIS